jgi:hypothetical protein
MMRRTEEKAPTAHATSWEDIAAKGAGEIGRDKEVAEGGTQHNIQTELATKNYEDAREEHAAEGRLILQEKRDLLNARRLEETCSSSDSAVTKASADLVLTHKEVDRMEWSAIGQKEETVDTRRTTPPTEQKEQKEDIQSNGE